MKTAMWVFWPSFVTALIGTVLFFRMHDPVDLVFVGPLELSRTAGYSIAFFFFWAIGAASSAFTCFLQRRA